MSTADEGATWSTPRPVARELTGDRHTAQYAPDGRLVVTFRDMAANSATTGDWMVWVGHFGDLLSGAPGQFRVRLADNTDRWDSSYPGLEVLRDGTFVGTTYGHWAQGQPLYIVSTQVTVQELDRLVERRQDARRRAPVR